MGDVDIVMVVLRVVLVVWVAALTFLLITGVREILTIRRTSALHGLADLDVRYRCEPCDRAFEDAEAASEHYRYWHDPARHGPEDWEEWIR